MRVNIDQLDDPSFESFENHDNRQVCETIKLDKAKVRILEI